MILGNTQRVNCNNRMYNVPKKEGYHIVTNDTTTDEGNVLYCYSDGTKLIDAIEVFECTVTRQEKLIGTIGNPKHVKKYYSIL